MGPKKLDTSGITLYKSVELENKWLKKGSIENRRVIEVGNKAPEEVESVKNPAKDIVNRANMIGVKTKHLTSNLTAGRGGRWGIKGDRSHL